MDHATAEFLKTFQWPPGRAEMPSHPRQLSLRHRIPRSSVTEEESAVRFLESFWPSNPKYSHVLVLSPQAQLSPQFFHCKFLEPSCSAAQAFVLILATQISNIRLCTTCTQELPVHKTGTPGYRGSVWTCHRLTWTAQSHSRRLRGRGRLLSYGKLQIAMLRFLRARNGLNYTHSLPT